MAIINQGWAYVTASMAATTGSGPTESLQFHIGSGLISGSANLTFLTGSNELVVTGAILVEGDISASTSISASAFYGDGSNLSNVSAATSKKVDNAVGAADDSSPLIFVTSAQLGSPASSLSASSDFVWNANKKRSTLNGSLSASSFISASAFYGDGSTLSNLAGGVNLDVQLNKNGNLTGSTNLSFNPGSSVLAVIGSLTASTNITASGIYTTVMTAETASFTLVNTSYKQAVATIQKTNFSASNFMVYPFSTKGSVLTASLPAIAIAGGYQWGLTYTFKDAAGSAITNSFLVLPYGAETIDGAAGAVIATNYGAMTVTSISGGMGGEWMIVSTN
jgi:hypothetical protein